MDDMYREGQKHDATQGKLVLSNSPEGNVQPQSANDQTSFMSAGNLQSPFMSGAAPPFAAGWPGYYPPPVQPRESILQKLRTNPAYQVLAVAIVIVLIASSALAAFAATGMGSNPNNNHANQPLAQAQTTATPRPTQTYITVPTPTPAPTQAPTPVQQQPTQPPPDPGGNPSPTSGGTLPVQFVNPPQQASPDTYYPITVQTQPGATVDLTITYEVNNGPTGDYTGQADENGIATLNWAANDTVSSYTQPVSVLFTATAQDANGNTGQAQTTVIVLRSSNN